MSWLTRWGLGEIHHVERLKHGPAGATSYLGKYLAKTKSKTIYANGHRVRMYETSRSWPRNPDIPQYFHGMGADHTPETPFCIHNHAHVHPEQQHYEQAEPSNTG